MFDSVHRIGFWFQVSQCDMSPKVTLSDIYVGINVPKDGPSSGSIHWAEI